VDDCRVTERGRVGEHGGAAGKMEMNRYGTGWSDKIVVAESTVRFQARTKAKARPLRRGFAQANWRREIVIVQGRGPGIRFRESKCFDFEADRRWTGRVGFFIMARRF